MANEVAVANAQVMQPVDMAVITEYLDSTGLTKSLLPKEKAMFVEMAKAYGLNPFKREIYCTAFGEGQYRQCSIVTGYEVYLKRAERIGKLDGWEVTTDGKVGDKTLSATVTIHRKDWTHPFRHTVYFREVCQTKKDGSLNRFWEKQPYFMTKKVAMAQAFRLCFPDEFGGMPYTSDEMGVEQEAPIVERNITPPKQEVPRQEVRNVAPAPAPVPANPAPADDGPVEACVMLEQLLNQYAIELQGKPYKIANDCLKNPESSDADYRAMYDRCMAWLKNNHKI